MVLINWQKTKKKCCEKSSAVIECVRAIMVIVQVAIEEVGRKVKEDGEVIRD